MLGCLILHTSLRFTQIIEDISNQNLPAIDVIKENQIHPPGQDNVID